MTPEHNRCYSQPETAVLDLQYSTKNSRLPLVPTLTIGSGKKVRKNGITFLITSIFFPPNNFTKRNKRFFWDRTVLRFVIFIPPPPYFWEANFLWHFFRSDFWGNSKLSYPLPLGLVGVGVSLPCFTVIFCAS